VILSRRPGRVERIIPIDLPRPRQEHVVMEPKFLSYADQIWGHIRDQAREALTEENP
jgi:NitT/TauT family transport system ATP-binding protein